MSHDTQEHEQAAAATVAAINAGRDAVPADLPAPCDLPPQQNEDVSGGRTEGWGQSGPPFNHNETLLEDHAEEPCAG